MPYDTVVHDVLILIICLLSNVNKNPIWKVKSSWKSLLQVSRIYNKSPGLKFY